MRARRRHCPFSIDIDRCTRQFALTTHCSSSWGRSSDGGRGALNGTRISDGRVADASLGRLLALGWQFQYSLSTRRERRGERGCQVARWALLLWHPWRQTGGYRPPGRLATRAATHQRELVHPLERVVPKVREPDYPVADESGQTVRAVLPPTLRGVVGARCADSLVTASRVSEYNLKCMLEGSYRRERDTKGGQDARARLVELRPSVRKDESVPCTGDRLRAGADRGPRWVGGGLTTESGGGGRRRECADVRGRCSC